QVGQSLWPELGERLGYLLHYPHGCVEQTTSSTLPLLATRTILPRIGVGGMSKAELDKRISAGLAPLATLRRASGDLAYWPGGSEPNIYGTAYAMRAVVLAQKAGVELRAGRERRVGAPQVTRITGESIGAASLEAKAPRARARSPVVLFG